MASRTEDELLSSFSAQGAKCGARTPSVGAGGASPAQEAISSSLDLEESLEAIVHQASTIAGEAIRGCTCSTSSARCFAAA